MFRLPPEWYGKNGVRSTELSSYAVPCSIEPTRSTYGTGEENMLIIHSIQRVRDSSSIACTTP
ncbi:hypothetical protein ASPCADRAFT_202642 [Aspergillus carbonarius ITEM 5010]|uniref:Uncharacterized protein n=1 Tax=Aspergillus carbonarius (strain ITEM 5010) TaxID=602072 RepID=A0A1R3S217_ASPC5|nr:hypothetical protein ASPCADRAFT_202642 [Aspergillus carbonarius ITEM 5010]